MIEIVVVFCLGASAECREIRHPMDSPLPMACVIAGQREAQDFLRDHPRWRMRGWRCEVNVPHQVPA
jgi:hypothetical protein